MADYPIAFLDLKERNNKERQRLADRQFALQLQFKTDGRLPPELQTELDSITNKLTDAAGDPTTFVLDPLYGGDKTITDPNGNPIFADDPPGVREILGQMKPPQVDDHLDGLFPSQKQALAPPVGVVAVAAAAAYADLTSSERSLAAVYGLLELDNQTAPDLPRFSQAVSSGLGEYYGSDGGRLFDEVLKILLEEGEQTAQLQARGQARNAPVPLIEIRANQWAAVVRALRAQGVQADSEHLPLLVRDALGRTVGAGQDAPPDSIDIDLPDLEAQSDLQIQANNVRAMQAIYFAAMLEEVNMFRVVDTLVVQFQNGMLPLGRGNAGRFLYAYWKKSINRFTEVERRNLYARTYGFPGGEASQETVNREFDDLWLRFVSAVTSYVRQFQVDDLLRSRAPFSLSQEQVRKSARDLAANLSLHGYGIAYFAATDLQNQIQEIITLLSDPDIKTAYGARDMWQVIDQVATLELGGAKNSIRYRTMATAGAIIIRWLAEHAPQLAASNQAPILDVSQIRNPPVRPKGQKPTVNPTDKDLVDACDQWLAVTGTQEDSVEQYAQPTVGPNVTSRPIQIPRVAQDLLASVGIKSNGAVSN
jgi:hypothetical protein